MKLPSEFIRLPLRFDPKKLAEEALAFEQSEWLPHVQKFAGNSSIPLISVRGEMNDDFNGPMQITDKLHRSPYLKQVLASFGEVFGRSRLMGLEGHCRVPEHRDVNYHWYSRVRIHIPIVTNPNVTFYCGETHLHMAPGETWIFDSWQKHRVENNSDQFRIHLVVDTAGSPRFWRMVDSAEWRSAKQPGKPASVPDRIIKYDGEAAADVQTENFNAPLVMGPGEVDALTTDISVDMHAFDGNQPQPMQRLDDAMKDFRFEWRRLWSLFGQSRQGWPHYEKLLHEAQQRLPRLPVYLASNGGSATHTFGQRVLAAALNTGLADQYISE
jgi:Aspartyl/Asparaginyl beta-hydroxylase